MAKKILLPIFFCTFIAFMLHLDYQKEELESILKNQIHNLESRIGNTNNFEKRIGDLESRVCNTNNFEKRIGDLESQIGNLELRIINLESISKIRDKGISDKTPKTPQSLDKGILGEAPKVPHGSYQIYRGPRGGLYHYSKNGKKVYEKKK